MKAKRRSTRARLMTARRRIERLGKSLPGEQAILWDGTKLRDERRALGMTQAALAEAMSLRDAVARGSDLRQVLDRYRQHHVSRWERGQAPTADTLALILRVFRDRGDSAVELV